MDQTASARAHIVDEGTGGESLGGVHEDQTAELDALNEVIMAIDIRDHGTLGCAYYVAKDECMYCMDDAKLAGLDMVELCKYIQVLISYAC